MGISEAYDGIQHLPAVLSESVPLIPAARPSGSVDTLQADIFNRTLERGTGLRVPELEMGGSRAYVPVWPVRRRPGRLLRGAHDGNIRLTPYILGKGACGEVVVCFNERTRELMAAKKVRVNELAREHLEDEAGAYLKGRSVITPLAILCGPKKTYMLQALCPGNVQNVVDTLSGDDGVVARVALALLAGRQTLAALDVLHEQGLGHRDVKPMNLLYRGDEVLLADYDRVTAQGAASLMPTLWYAPPEALGLRRGNDLAKVDVWSLGTSLLEIACAYDERVMDMRERVAVIVEKRLSASDLPRGGAFEVCYATCIGSKEYEPLLMLTQAVLVRALMLVYDRLLTGDPPDRVLPPPPPPGPSGSESWADVPEDDPIRLIPNDLRRDIQACAIASMQDMPLHLRMVVRRMLHPEPSLRPDVRTLLKQLNLSLLDGACHPEKGKQVLKRASQFVATQIRSALLPEVRPPFLTRVRRWALPCLG